MEAVRTSTNSGVWFQYWHEVRNWQEHQQHVAAQINDAYPATLRGCLCTPVLDSHSALHSAGSVHLCLWCDLSFSNGAHLMAHIARRHPRLGQVDRPDQPTGIDRCSRCRMMHSFIPTKYNAFQPIQPVRPFECDMCALRFGDINSRDRHRRTHHGSDCRFECEHCARRLVSKKHLKLHISVHHKKEFHAKLRSKTPSRSLSREEEAARRRREPIVI